jgi:hypothetical protein
MGLAAEGFDAKEICSQGGQKPGQHAQGPQRRGRRAEHFTPRFEHEIVERRRIVPCRPVEHFHPGIINKPPGERFVEPKAAVGERIQPNERCGDEDQCQKRSYYSLPVLSKNQ